jgi:hypothetical protein
MTGRLRLIVLLAIVVVVGAGATTYVLLSKRDTRRRTAEQRAAATVAVRGDLPAVDAAPHIAFRTTALGDSYGRVAVVPLDDPDGPRAITPASCDRVHAAHDTAICLATSSGFTQTYTANILGKDWNPVRPLPLQGIPSRARVARDGTLYATTSFVRGDSYANPGQFSTRTIVSRGDGTQVADVEEFALFVDGRQLTAADRNLWGVTFVDADTFFATAASGGRTWLVRGSLGGRRLTALQEDAECPSVSPDGTRVVYKKRGRLPVGQWRITAYDLAAHTETALAETRSVDDQVEWLDDAHVIYGLPRPGAAVPTSDVWNVAADGSGSPAVLIHDAWSPAVVR